MERAQGLAWESRKCIALCDEWMITHNYRLAYAEMFTALAMVLARFKFELFETDVSDVELEHAYMMPIPKWSSKGVRVKVNAI